MRLSLLVGDINSQSTAERVIKHVSRKVCGVIGRLIKYDRGRLTMQMRDVYIHNYMTTFLHSTK